MSDYDNEVAPHVLRYLDSDRFVDPTIDDDEQYPRRAEVGTPPEFDDCLLGSVD